LLIVIVVIGILAAISLVSYNGVQQRAKVSSIASTLKSTEKAFRMLGTEQGISSWWIETQFTGAGNPSINQIIAASNLKNYIQNANIPDGYTLLYDNDGDIYDGCSVSAAGVKVFAYGIPVPIVQRLDNQMDDGNLSCGKIVYNPGDTAMSYHLSNTQQF
jgi:type II secretory pathway pseudopilin PulG